MNKETILGELDELIIESIPVDNARIIGVNSK